MTQPEIIPEHLRELIARHTDATIEFCAQLLTDRAKAIRAGMSGGGEPGWIEADALDRAASDIRKMKDEPK